MPMVNTQEYRYRESVCDTRGHPLDARLHKMNEIECLGIIGAEEASEGCRVTLLQ